MPPTLAELAEETMAYLLIGFVRHGNLGLFTDPGVASRHGDD
ncbi:MAG TPA: hypothetical protein VFA97_06465 [Gaiellaceae bacterium]|nr:hypothetical protein [Gaiellaceae bacterium]